MESSVRVRQLQNAITSSMLLLILPSKIAVLRLELILTIKGFCCGIALLFYGTVLKFLSV